jgi:hypothetical protein
MYLMRLHTTQHRMYKDQSDQSNSLWPRCLAKLENKNYVFLFKENFKLNLKEILFLKMMSEVTWVNQLEAVGSPILAVL